MVSYQADVSSLADHLLSTPVSAGWTRLWAREDLLVLHAVRIQGMTKSLRYPGHGLGPIADGLSEALRRFAFYSERFMAALDRVDHGERKWVDAPRIDSCHTVWFELHEDLLATLGLDRGAAPTA